MVKLTSTYLAERRAAVHTDESFSKAVLEQALDAAQAKLGSGEADEVDLDAKITVRPYSVPTAGIICAEVCVVILGKRICKHVGI